MCHDNPIFTARKMQMLKIISSAQSNILGTNDINPALTKALRNCSRKMLVEVETNLVSHVEFSTWLAI